MKKPRLALYLPNLDGGGAERMMVNLAVGFAKQGFEVDVVLAVAQGPFLKLLPDTVTVHDLQASGVVASLPKLVTYLRQHRPVALLATLNHASVVAILARKLAGTRTRVVVREANMLFPIASKRRVVKSMKLAVRLFYPSADAFIAVSQGVAADLQRFVKLPAEKVHTVYNPVVTDDLQARAQEQPQHPWFAPGQPPVIMGAGRLEHPKGFDLLIRAFAEVRAQREARLVIFGEGGQRAALEQLAAELGVQNDVSLPGFTQNPFAHMARADTFVLSSWHEGLPGVLIQAMACGCKVVSTDCPSGPREILQGGTLGQLTPVGDYAALAAAVAASLELSREAEGHKLRARAADFSDTKIVPEYLKVLLPD